MKKLMILSAAVALAQGGHLGLSASHHGAPIAIPTRVSYGGPLHSIAAPSVAYGAQAFSSQPLYLSGGSPAGGFAAGVRSGGRPRLHEIHTHSGRQLIRLEEFHGPNQIIRVHEQPQAPPQIIKIAAPAEAPSLIRVVSKSSGRAHVERIVHRAPGPQVFDIKKPARAPARIVQLVRAPAPAPRFEFVQEPEDDHQIYVAHAPAPAPLPPPGAGLGISADEFEPSSDGLYGGQGSQQFADEARVHGNALRNYFQAEDLHDGSGIVEPRNVFSVPTRTVESGGW